MQELFSILKNKKLFLKHPVKQCGPRISAQAFPTTNSIFIQKK